MTTRFGPASATPPFYKGYPFDGRITDQFGTLSAWRKSQGMGWHTGVDLAAPEGTPILAPAAGKFVWSGWTEHGLGFITILDHGDCGTLYAHQPETWRLFKPGDRVAAGDRIGTVGNTGMSSGPHLHWMATTKARSGRWDFSRAGGGLFDPLTRLVSAASVKPPPAPTALRQPHRVAAFWTQAYQNGAKPIRYEDGFAVYEIRVRE